MTDERTLAYSYIRLSTELQRKGHGRQRQLEASAAYAKSRGWQLVETLEDIRSAFRGANVEYGALGLFLAAIEQHMIPGGSYLIVESLDRLSRQPTRKSLALFLRILNAGINVFSLQDGREYLADENTDDLDLLASIVI